MQQCYLHTHDADELALRNDALDHSHASAVHHLASAYFRALDYLMHNPQDDTQASLLHPEFLPADPQAK